MWFLTSSTFRLSAKSPSTLPSTPIETSIISASIVCLPLGVSTSTLTPVAVFSTLPVFELVRIVMPALGQALRAGPAETSSSSPGRIRSSSSTTVTLVPIAL